MYRIISALFFLLIGLSALAQKTYTLKGKVLDAQDDASLPGATILLISKADSLKQSGTITNQSGDFNIDMKPGEYNFQVSFLGYKSIKKSVTVDKSAIDLGQFKLSENTEVLQAVNVTEKMPPTKLKGDTTVYNPNAFKVNPDATTGELLAKMPGFDKVDGKLVVEGQKVAEILVDGKKFFGNNMNQALRVIPSDVVKNIEVYEYKDDEEKFTGFKKAEEDKKTINIVTKKKKNKRLVFGDVAAGYGKDNRYGFVGSVNSFSDNNKVTITAASKDVNAPLKLNNRGFGRTSISGNEIQDDSFGFNVVNSKNENSIVTSYRYSNRESTNTSKTVKTYITDVLAGQVQNSSSKSNSDNDSHRVSLRASLKSNKKYRLTTNTSFSISDGESSSHSTMDTYLEDDPLNSNFNRKSSERNSNNINQNIYYSRKLNDKGRSLSINGGISYSKSESDGKQRSETVKEDNVVSQSIDRISDSETKRTGMNGGLSFSERIGEKGHASCGYTYSYSNSSADKLGYNFNEEANAYTDLDELTTNKFENSTIRNSGRVAYNYSGKKHGVRVGASFDFTTLKNEESFPKQTDMEEDFFSFRPYARYSLNMENHKRINVNYSSRTSTPSLRDLQEIVDVSNPMNISTGNADLKQSRSHSFSAYYSASNTEKATHLSFSASASTTNNTVGRRTIIATKDTTINDLYFLPAGGHFSEPVNLDGRYSLNSRVTYSFPVEKLKSKLNINTGGGFSHNPTFVNGKKAYTDSWNLNHRMTLSSNISEKVDFTFSTSTNYRQSKNTSTSGSEYVSQYTALNMYYNFYKNVAFRTNASNNYQNNFTTNNEDSFWHLNLGLSTKVFNNKRGELSCTAYDVLGKDDQRSHIVRDLYTADYYRNKLTKFYIFTFSYKLRNSKGKKA
ncbi:TonB-dependent receptor [Puteibacter caeruleilacunae]|nr:TonB-dependent receptor [Puteibacter caeruleilacunae]